MIRHACTAAALLTVVLPGRLLAQSSSSSLEDLRQRQVPAAEKIKEDVAEAPYSLGALRLLPRVEIRELGYDNNVFGTSDNVQSDWVARVQAGLRLILPVGPKVYLVGDALPGYDAYLRHSELRSWSGDYDAGALALFNRLSIEARGFDDRHREILSSEVLQLVERRNRGGSAAVEVEVFHRLGVVGEYKWEQFRYSAGGAPLSPDLAGVVALDRIERTARGGLRYHVSDHISVSGLVEESAADFARPGNARNNKSRAYLLAVHYDRPHLYLDLSGGRRKIDEQSGSGFPAFSGATGSFYAELVSPAERLGLEAWGHRGIDYGLYANIPYFREELVGGGPFVRLGRRLRLAVYAETGSNLYPVPVTVGGGAVTRRDRVRTEGGELSVELSRRLLVRLRAASTRYDTNIPGLDRKVFRVQAGMSLNGEIFR
jgi:hypothetical protein